MSEFYFEKSKHYLETELKLRQQRRPAYSLRAFARDLDMSPSSLSCYLNDKQGLSKERAVFIGKKLQWTAKQTEHFADLVTVEYSPYKTKKKAALVSIETRTQKTSKKITQDQFNYISDWRHLACLTLIQMHPALETYQTVAKKLGLKMTQASKILENLIRLQLCQRQEDGKYVAKQNVTMSGGESPSKAVQAFHAGLMAKAQESIEKQSFDQRNLFSIIYSINGNKIPLVQREIEQSILQILGKYTSEPGEDCIQGFSLQNFSIYKEGES